MESKVIGGVKIEASEWSKGSQKRIYFRDGRTGKTGACWDVNKSEWSKVRGEFAPKFKALIKSAYSL